MGKFAIAQFTAKTSSAGIVNVELGFIPDYVRLITEVAGTAPDRYDWCNNDTVPAWAVAQGILDDGADGVTEQDSTSITKYAGGDIITADETTDTAGKHVNLRGLAASAGHVTAPGITIPADNQVAGAKHVVLAWQADAVPTMQPAS